MRKIVAAEIESRDTNPVIVANSRRRIANVLFDTSIELGLGRKPQERKTHD